MEYQLKLFHIFGFFDLLKVWNTWVCVWWTAQHNCLEVWEDWAANIFLELFFQEEEAKQLVRDAIASGIYNDLGSGSNIDLCVISKNKLDFLRPYDTPNKKGER